MSSVEGTVPAGWYPDPTNQSQLRYWDGSAWTEHCHQTDQPQAAPALQTQPADAGITYYNPAQQAATTPTAAGISYHDPAQQAQGFASPGVGDYQAMSNVAPSSVAPSHVDLGFTDHVGSPGSFSARPDAFEPPPDGALPQTKVRRASKNPFVHWANATLRRPFDFGGRSRRAEYWFTTLADFIIYFALGALMVVLGDGDEPATAPLLLILGYLLLMSVARLSLQIRRLHDTSRSGWWLLVSFVPFIGSFILLYFFLIDGDRFTNLYGESPKYVQPPKQRAKWY